MKTPLAAILFAALTAQPVAAEDGGVPHSTLQRLGLGGMRVMSDAEGMQVRSAIYGPRSVGMFIRIPLPGGTSTMHTFVLARVNYWQSPPPAHPPVRRFGRPPSPLMHSP